MALRNLLLMTKEMRLLLQKQRSAVIPVILSGVIAAVLPVIHCGFILYKTNEICWKRGERMLCEKHQYIIDGAPPPCHRYIIMNQKYEWPPGLLKALKGDDNSDQKKLKKCSFKFWKKEDALKDSDDDDES